jgi:hypothetical protein
MLTRKSFFFKPLALMIKCIDLRTPVIETFFLQLHSFYQKCCTEIDKICTTTFWKGPLPMNDINNPPFPKKTSCNSCSSRPCQWFLKNYNEPGTFMFVNKSDFLLAPCVSSSQKDGYAEDSKVHENLLTI